MAELINNQMLVYPNLARYFLGGFGAGISALRHFFSYKISIGLNKNANDFCQ